MATNIIINGAAGRMGSTLTRLTREAADLNLSGVVERESHIGSLADLECPAATSLKGLSLEKEAAVVVDFTAPAVSVALAESAADMGFPAVIGTTGLSAEEVERLRAAARKTPLFWAPNMSVGVNVLLSVLPLLAEKLGAAYDVEIMEIHHNKKKDAPSGTALKLAQALAEARGWELEDKARYCREGIIGARPSEELGVQTLRGGDVVGDHTVYFLGPGERIEITHRAHTRETFAQGALRAARWIASQQPGRLYSMADMF